MEDWTFDVLHELESRYWWFAARREIILDCLATLLTEDRTYRIVDVGCGPGFFLEKLARFGSVKGIDPSAAALAYARQRGAAVAQGALPDQLPCAADWYDVVTLLDVLEHVEDDLRALRELHRILKYRGVLLCAVPAYRWLWSIQDDLGRHRRRYVLEELKAKMEQAGFRVKRISYFNTFLFPLGLFAKLLQSRAESLMLLRVPPPLINVPLRMIFAWEKYWLRKKNFRWGLSLLAIGEKL